jgi:hypothetical protein
MPWQECSKVDERLRFVARVLEGEKIAVLCREFDISRKTGNRRPAHQRCFAFISIDLRWCHCVGCEPKVS